MGSQDFGSQILSFDFNEDATGKKFNKTQYGLTPSGIYSGFTLERFSDSMVRITTGVCYIHDETQKLGTRIETQESVVIEIDSTKPYVVLRFIWIDAKDNFMDFIAVAYEDIQTGDLVVGRVIYENSGITMTENYDYTRRNTFYNKRNKDTQNYFKVQSTEPISKRVFVTSGILNSPKGNLYVAGGTYPSTDIPDTTTGSRNDIIYIDEDGLIKFEAGIQSSVAVTPRYGNRKVLAEIRRGPNRTSIYGSEIYPVLTSFDMTAYPSDLTIVDANNLYSSNNVEDALQEIAGSPFTFKSKKTFNNSINVVADNGDVGETIKGSAGQDIQRILKSDNTVVQSVSATGKLINTVGTELALLDKYGTFTVDKVEEAINQMSGEPFTFKETKTFAVSPIVPNATANQHPITKSVYDAHVAKTGQSSIGHVKSGGNITINSDGTITIANNTITTDSAHISDATNLNTGNKIVRRDSSGNFSAGTITATLNGNASTASKFNTSRTITLNGASNTSASSSADTGNHTIDIRDVKVNNAGYADSAGSAGSASKITKRKIGGTDFDGTADITPAYATSAGSCTGNSATATTATTATTAHHIPTSDPGGVGAIWLA
ncbi:MAG: hypothetical protein BWY38_03112 [Ignavibacteria bacterium ADurb.Bin266]|nr:MAG: hypothetical protein BWY38_03112 [Ignavibacteria bacterium ADurb.Bin266]